MPDQALAQLGNSLRDARLKCGLTQEELAETANLSKKYISSIERGKSNPTYDVLRRLIIALDIPAEALFRTSADEKSSEEKEAVTFFFWVFATGTKAFCGNDETTDRRIIQASLVQKTKEGSVLCRTLNAINF